MFVEISLVVGHSAKKIVLIFSNLFIEQKKMIYQKIKNEEKRMFL